MITLPFVFLALSTASAVNASPLQKRIAQVISQSTAQWEQACLAAGGSQQCNPISVSSMATLLAGGGACDQQNAADTMIDLAKQLNNSSEMIRLAQLFAQQPRNSPDSLSVPYCQSPPKNAELDGLFQCQFEGVDKTKFTTGAVGTAGTIPLAFNAPVNPPGSCPAHPQGPIPDGEQLNEIVQDPGVSAGTGNGTGRNSNENNTSTDSTNTTDISTPTDIAIAVASPTPSPSGSNGGSASSGFALQNGKDAQALNARFQTLSADSSCNEGENACVNGAFAQCVGSKFTTTQCAGGTICAALPLVNSRGTSVTCTTQQDAVDRIARTGATGGMTGTD